MYIQYKEYTHSRRKYAYHKPFFLNLTYINFGPYSLTGSWYHFSSNSTAKGADAISWKKAKVSTIEKKKAQWSV